MKAAFRFDGIDLARGLAIVGMVFAHLGPTGFDGGVVADYTSTAFAGYPSALFAVLAGVSLGLFHERGADDPVRTRLATLVRGVILLVAGTLMSMVQSTIAIVLSTIAVIYLLLFWLPRCKTWVISVVIAVLATVSSVGFVLVDLVPFGFELFMPPYPVLAWLTYGAVGVLVHRFLVGNTKAQAIAVVPALLLAAVGFVIRVNNAAVFPYDPLADYTEPQFDKEPLVQLLLTQSFEPHTGLFGDLLASITCAIAVICLCCLLCQVRWANILAYPLRAVGAMALTTYVAHVFIAGFFMLGGIPLDAGKTFDISGTGPVQYSRVEPAEGSVHESTESENAAETDKPEKPDEINKPAKPDEPDPSFQRYQKIIQEADTWQEYDELTAEFWDGKSNGWVLGDDEFDPDELDVKDAGQIHNWATAAWNALGLIVFAAVWKVFFRRGPLEWVVARLINKAVLRKEVSMQ
ncbi:heparan-alpha-glucosaminide N-acetyltransferase domain-containing protein [Corynebacterium pseudodiphtheriticum]|uniref:heparan-alpha-glucosaminide N-acetyltransferase domain-containing protein n=1 Tax=Corynebacterium pseudodiphtheriticum TaxID=37637 RepID=UPI000F8675B9|nr:heparan-alpha-glucosaminide N-acetyltransferase domain-containing protein [Corynebacterium pseudodiphtheriticum]MDK4250187.1 heparan-alpha-glucosaminide N-acetyltransferase domain-containing protein [Corynebacterium pseudodiphtheriticum]MDK4286460.1 heparan-alpha-glucosaminide N-acetyltransferase domain-containing protein [Corynebacterium pseudodiphtheriticum]MDK4288808.1 heparan-alpha-glucosaminide N-acetyltransferase domain-containing protein [Corynebacterium pseudodiphtheriticum]MDK430550